jgi:hypothetical protein
MRSADPNIVRFTLLTADHVSRAVEGPQARRVAGVRQPVMISEAEGRGLIQAPRLRLLAKELACRPKW